jgi:hypothetical protein
MDESIFESVNSMSIKELRETIKKAGMVYYSIRHFYCLSEHLTSLEKGLSHTDCLEKSDLKERCKEALKRIAEAEATKQTQPETSGERAFGGYSCILKNIEQGAGSLDLVVVFLHGYGATNNGEFGLIVPARSVTPLSTQILQIWTTK